MENQLLYEIYTAYAGELSLYLYSLCRDRELANDLLQEVFLKAMLSLPPDHGNFRAWLYKVARNLCFNALRNQKREIASDDPVAETGLLGEFQIRKENRSPLDHILESERNRRLYKGILQLSSTASQVILLQYFGGLSQKEIATVLGISPGNVRVIALRARVQLREHMEAYEKEGTDSVDTSKGGATDEL
ncbi:MAG: RNA polymerase sigma factor [Firmicutes bacterium]|nr:RNA polymerase sigma factor [Bacillota bacterium]